MVSGVSIHALELPYSQAPLKQLNFCGWQPTDIYVLSQSELQLQGFKVDARLFQILTTTRLKHVAYKHLDQTYFRTMEI